jgi:putative ABC transport system permease protein
MARRNGSDRRAAAHRRQQHRTARRSDVVGVVGNVQQVALDEPPTWDLYIAYAQMHRDSVGLAAGNMFWVVRTPGDPANLETSIAREVRRLDPDVVASPIVPASWYLDGAVAPRRFGLAMVVVFAAAALALAVTGIYAVVAYGVSQRTRELAIRQALGATRAAILRLVVGQGATFVAVGLAAGLAIASGTTRLIGTLLFGVAASDIGTFGQVAALVAVISLAACALPAMRVGPLAARVFSGE